MGSKASETFDCTRYTSSPESILETVDHDHGLNEISPRFCRSGSRANWGEVAGSVLLDVVAA